MKNKVYGKKLSRSTTARRALMRSLVKALVLHGSIATTKAKAVFLKRNVEKLIVIAKRDNIAARRRVLSKLGNDSVTTDKLFDLTKKVFSQRNGGFTRVVNLPRRRGDSAQISQIEWSVTPLKEEEKKNKTKQPKEKKEKRSLLKRVKK